MKHRRFEQRVTQDDVMDAPNDVTMTTSGGNNSRAISEAVDDF